ncbi:bifunctional UDP-N-acetylglucosamine diphosphorylase/glucosamine-1-phosphate N-acetyltransferase GlmU [Flagellatimonas centrodinii]|nr:bifunctional UDP-N-acetylglucosamine diphosphorylase/glucosamine-1-phosphate N-acetyltransferase GlmU [Flagellatimonas centrodinii]
MNSVLPKVLHRVGGKPMLGHVLDAGQAVGAAVVHVVHGHGAEAVQSWVKTHYRGDAMPRWIHQAEQLGTGHAVAQAAPDIPDDACLLVAYGDVPLIRPETLQALATAAADGLALVTVRLDDPGGYGRVVRTEDGAIRAIIEDKDASPAQRQITEINTGLIAAPARLFKPWLTRIDNNNRKGEYYLTDVVGFAVADGIPVTAVVATDADEVEGVNDRLQLARAERVYQRRQAVALMRAGVALADPARFDLRGTLSTGRDVEIDIGCVFEGTVTLADGVRIGPYCLLRDVSLGAGAEVAAHSVLEGVTAGAAVHIGPFARLRPGTRLAEGARIGNFVETKKTDVGAGSKINHLSYVGDATLGQGVNIGAGTITCNYDGINKHATTIGDGAFIGSNSSLVAPVSVGEQATIGAGSVITKDAPDGQLTVARGKQISLPGWQRPTKKDR